MSVDPTALTVVEGQSNAYAVVLTTQPSADVTVTVTGHAGTDLSLSGQTLTNDELTLTPDNWNQPQTVTVTAGNVTADAEVILGHAFSGGDYDSLTADVRVTVLALVPNQLTIQVGVAVSEQTLSVPEGGSNTYEVVLGEEPTGDVTITVTVEDSANNDVSTDEASLVFTPGNWNQPQSVTVRAAHDDDARQDPTVSISHGIRGANYRQRYRSRSGGNHHRRRPRGRDGFPDRPDRDRGPEQRLHRSPDLAAQRRRDRHHKRPLRQRREPGRSHPERRDSDLHP